MVEKSIPTCLIIPVKCDAKKNKDVYILSIATSTTSAPAAAHASMLAAAMHAVSLDGKVRVCLPNGANETMGGYCMSFMRRRCM